MRLYLGILILLLNFHLSCAHNETSPSRKVAGFENIVFDSLQLDPVQSERDLTHEVSVTAILFHRSGWDKAKIQSFFQRTAEIYSRCGIKFQVGNLLTLESPEGTVVNIAQVEDLSKMMPQDLPKPWIFFVSQPVDRDGSPNTAYAIPRKPNFAPESHDTIWLGSYTTTTHYKLSRDHSYNPLAHELAHVLGDYDHVIGKNILGEFENGNDQITDEQCRKFKTFDQMREIKSSFIGPR